MILANLVQGLMIFNDENYAPQRWHATLMMWAFIVVPVVCNLWLRRVLYTVEMLGAICHGVFFIATITTLAVMAERSPVDFVFKTLIHDVSGWTNPGVAWNIGLLTVTFPITSKSRDLQRVRLGL